MITLTKNNNYSVASAYAEHLRLYPLRHINYDTITQVDNPNYTKVYKNVERPLQFQIGVMIHRSICMHIYAKFK